jgi:glucose dehydrogenase
MGETTPHRYRRVTSPEFANAVTGISGGGQMGLRSRSIFAGVSLAAFAMVVASSVQANDSVVKAVSDPNGWAVAGHDYGNTRFSPLEQITSENVGKLQLVYSLSLASLRSNESSPVVIGDTLYVTTSWGPKYVYAVNAATGAQKWTYQPDIPDDVLQYACCDVNNRGVAYADGKIFIGRLDAMPPAARSFGLQRSSTTSRVPSLPLRRSSFATRSSPASAVANMVYGARFWRSI